MGTELDGRVQTSYKETVEAKDITVEKFLTIQEAGFRLDNNTSHSGRDKEVELP